MKPLGREKDKGAPIYQRPHSVEVTIDEYIKKYISTENAKSRLFNIGSGVWEHPCWTNLDLPAQTEAFAAIQSPFVAHDLVANTPFPIESNSADCFYTSHVVEHIPEEAVQKLMQEAHRCLDTDGCLRIVTGPCADLDWQAILRGEKEWWFWMGDADFKENVERDRPPMTAYDRWLYHLATPRSVYSDTPCKKKYVASEVEQLIAKHKDDPRPLLDLMSNGLTFNYGSPGDHISWWNFAKLKRFLEKAGFKRIIRSGYGQSVSILMRDLRYFDQTYPQISVYVEAFK